MKKLIISLILLLSICVNLLGCNIRPEDTVFTSNSLETTTLREASFQNTDTTPQIADTTLQTLSECNYQNCKLLINGKDVTENNYVIIESEYSADIPLLATMKSLGADIKKIENIIEISINEHSISLDLNKHDFGIAIPPGGGTRKIVNDDLIFDYVSISRLLKNVANAEILLDFENKIISINQKTGDGSVS